MKSAASILLVFWSLSLQAQGFIKPDSSFLWAMDSVLRDFPNNLRGITGDTILLEGETDHFSSTVWLPGAEQCQVTRYHSGEDTTASWQATMFHTEDYEKAAARYHALYKQLSKCFTHLKDGSIVWLEGQWSPPTPDLVFSVSTLKLSTRSYWYKKMEIELELLYQLGDWEIHINVASKEKDSENWIR
jgi:hypothetical protein